MNRYFLPETEIKLKGIEGSFIIHEIIGRGSSCVVYRTNFLNSIGEESEHLLKEFNPKHIDLIRDETGKLVIKETEIEKFNVSLQRFKAGYENQENFRRISGLKNYTANIQNTYYDYNTMYIDMSVTEGVSYAEVREKSIYDLVRRMKVLAEVVNRYHLQGYLHLDLKPSNIYVRPENETCEDVLLFDFDSMIKKSDAKLGKGISYTEEWAALELTCSGRRDSICEATDIFAIGEMIFEQIMERHSKSWERRTFSKYKYNVEASIFKDINPDIYKMLDNLFRHTLCNNVGDRYQSIDELLATLDDIISISNPERPYLKNSCPKPMEFFVGREKEMDEIRITLQTNRILFLSGTGGIGKSELAKNYVKQNQNCYDIVIFAPYQRSLTALIANDEIFPIHHFGPYPEEKMEEYSKRKFRKLKELCNERTLIIIDNFDCTEDDFLAELLKLNCQILFTTRMDFSDYNHGQMFVEELANDELFRLFHRYYTKVMTVEEYSCIEQIIDMVGGHTLTVELLAKQMMAGRIKPGKMLETITTKGIGITGKEKVLLGKDDKFVKGSVQEHIQALFDLSDLTVEEQYVLKNLSLIPYTGIFTEQFATWCELEDYETINHLIEIGWIRIEKTKDYISLHPVVADVVIQKGVEWNLNKMPLLINCVKDVRKNRSTIIASERYELANLFLRISEKIIRVNLNTKYVAHFLEHSAKLYKELNYLSDAIFYTEKALKIWIDLLGEKHFQTGVCYVDLAVLYKSKNRYDIAEDYVLKAKEIFLTMDGENSQLVAGFFTNLGTIYLSQYKFEIAEESFNKALEIYHLLNDKQQEGLALVYVNLASLYKKKENFDEAQEFYLKANKIFDVIYGEMNRESAMVYNSMADICKMRSKYKDTIEYDKAEEYIKKSLNIRRHLYGEVHDLVAKTYIFYGDICFDQRKFDLAEELFFTALKIFQEVLGEENKWTAIGYNSLGRIYRDVGKMEMAEEYCMKACNIMLRNFGTKSIEISLCYSTLGDVYAVWGKIEKAKQYYENAYLICCNLLGVGHPTTKRLATNIESLCNG